MIERGHDGTTWSYWALVPWERDVYFHPTDERSAMWLRLTKPRWPRTLSGVLADGSEDVSTRQRNGAGLEVAFLRRHIVQSAGGPPHAFAVVYVEDGQEKRLTEAVAMLNLALVLVERMAAWIRRT